MRYPFSTNFSIFLLLLALLPTTACSKNDSSERKEGGGEPVVETTSKILATISSQEVAGNSLGHSGASQIVFSKTGNRVAFVDGKVDAFRVVLDGKPGKNYQQIDYLMFSNDGRRYLYSAVSNNRWCLVVDGKEGEWFANVGLPRFSNDSRHVLYDVEEGGKWRLIVDHKKGELYNSYYDKTFSNDSQKIYVLKNPLADGGPVTAVTYDMALKELSKKEIQASSFVYSKDKTRIAMISGVTGSQKVVVYNYESPDLLDEGPTYESVGNQTFATDGNAVAYIAVKNGKRFLVVNGKEIAEIPEGEVVEPISISPDLKSVGIILQDNKGFFCCRVTGGKVTKGRYYEETAFSTFTKDGHAYAARNGKRMFYVVNGKESPAYDKILAPISSPDGKSLVCRVRKDGKRFIVILDTQGKVKSQHKSYEMVFDPTFTADGNSVAYGVKDGPNLAWKVEKL